MKCIKKERARLIKGSDLEWTKIHSCVPMHLCTFTLKLSEERLTVTTLVHLWRQIFSLVQITMVHFWLRRPARHRPLPNPMSIAKQTSSTQKSVKKDEWYLVWLRHDQINGKHDPTKSNTHMHERHWDMSAAKPSTLNQKTIQKKLVQMSGKVSIQTTKWTKCKQRGMCGCNEYVLIHYTWRFNGRWSLPSILLSILTHLHVYHQS